MLLGVDVGGTFTDAVLVVEGAEDAEVHTAKVPSTPEQSDGVMRAIDAVLAAAGAQPDDIGRFAHGMTVATNALLEFSEARPPARTALLATEGFTDVIELARQARAHLYRLCEPGPRPWAPPALRFGAPERMGPEGPIRPLQEAEARELVERVAQAAPEAVAVALLHSYAHPEHERELGALLAERLPGVHVSLSHELVGTFREYERAATTEVDAALSPLLGEYLRRLSEKASAKGLPEPEIMQSSGGTIDCERAARHAALTVLSGPAGGVGGALMLARAAGAENVLCFDMGGTSCDVCAIVDGEVVETAERSVAGRPLALPALDIHTVGAGGGSIAWRDAGGALRVGPQSAGAQPGPACYGRGGEEPTVTDANLLLGRLPRETPLAGRVRLDHEAARRAVAGLAAELGLSTEECAEGILRVAEAQMGRALRRVTIERGLDPRRFALMPFGGAGPLHAVALARELGIERILCPRAAGVLCALGLAGAPARRDAARTVMLAGETLTAERVGGERDALIRRVRAELGEEGNEEGEGRSARDELPRRKQSTAGVRAEDELPRRARSAAGVRAQVRVRYELRYGGQSFELGVERSGPACEGPLDLEELRESFAELHEERYGYRDEEAPLELVTIRVSAWGHTPAVALASAARTEPARERRGVILDGREVDAEYLRGELPPGTRVEGPAVCSLGESTLFLPPGWVGETDAQGTVHLEAASHSATHRGRPEGRPSQPARARSTQPAGRDPKPPGAK
ncbi:MAG: hydantoinase/oxoprolinase family protein [Solirubrobacterales bacterium]